MAKIHEEVVVIKLSKLVKEKDSAEQYIATNDICDALQAVAEELAGAGVVVEVERAWHVYYNVDTIRQRGHWYPKR